MCKNSNFVFVLPMKIWLNPSKVGTFSKICPDLTGNSPISPKTNKHLSVFCTWDMYLWRRHRPVCKKCIYCLESPNVLGKKPRQQPLKAEGCWALKRERKRLCWVYWGGGGGGGGGGGDGAGRRVVTDESEATTRTTQNLNYQMLWACEMWNVEWNTEDGRSKSVLDSRAEFPVFIADGGGGRRVVSDESEATTRTNQEFQRNLNYQM